MKKEITKEWEKKIDSLGKLYSFQHLASVRFVRVEGITESGMVYVGRAEHIKNIVKEAVYSTLLELRKEIKSQVFEDCFDGQMGTETSELLYADTVIDLINQRLK